MKKAITACLLFAIGSVTAQAAMVAKNIDYDVGGKKMQSVLVYDDAVKTLRPGLVMTPDWLGMNPDQLAPGQRCAATSNRNFEGRQGKGGRTHLVSPAVAAATAVRGTLSAPADLN